MFDGLSDWAIFRDPNGQVDIDPERAWMLRLRYSMSLRRDLDGSASRQYRAR